MGSGVYLCGDPSNPYNCKDPNAPKCDSILVNKTGNGICDEDANNPTCNYDGGDCCEVSCKAHQIAKGRDPANCGPFTCKDRFYKKNQTVEVCNIGYTQMLGDGVCNARGNYNTKKCSWDGKWT